MSTTIDQKVVEMRFDNKDFEKNVSNTISSLDKLDKSANAKGAARGLQVLRGAADEVSQSLEKVEATSYKAGFSFGDILRKMSSFAEWHIARKAIYGVIDALKTLGDSLTGLSSIKAGFSEYETKINSIQTILSNTSNKGTTLDDVTAALDELNTYADKTIYNFAEMTSNIGKFTAAGVGLEDSVSSIKGIANLAAASGSSSQQASTAMYQLSQALSTGTVRLMDWNSVVNAGMGGEKFQEALKKTAKEHGVAVDDIIKRQGSFRESLSEGWLTADVLNETLKKFTVEGATEYANAMVESGKYTQEQADALIAEAQAMEDAATKVKTFTQLWSTLKETAQSGWAKSWELIVGDFEEAREFLSEISDLLNGVIGRFAESRNEMLENWAALGGRNDLIESLRNIFDAIASIAKPIGEAFRDIFPPLTAERLKAFTEGLKELTAKFKISDQTSNNLKRTFKGLFAVMDIAFQIFVAVTKAIVPLTGDLNSVILDIAATIGDWLVAIDNFLKKGNLFQKVLKGIANVISGIFKITGNIAKWFGKNFIEPMIGVTDAASDMASGVGESLSSMADALKASKFFTMMKSLWDGVVKIASGTMQAIGKFMGTIFDKIASGDFQSIFDLINSIITGGIGVAIWSIVLKIKAGIETLDGVAGNFKGIINGVTECLKAMQDSIRANALIKIAVAVAILAASLYTISTIDEEKLMGSIVGIASLMAGLLVAMHWMKKIGSLSGGLIDSFKTFITMTAFAVSIRTLASALREIGELSFGQIMTGLVGIAGLMLLMGRAAKELSKNNVDMAQSTVQMIAFAAAIKVLAWACTDIANLGWGGMARGVLGVAALAVVMVFVYECMDNTSWWKAAASALQMVSFALAMKILASTLDDIAYLSWGDLAKGLVALAGIAVILVGTAKILAMTPEKDLIQGTIAVATFAASFMIMSLSIQSLGDLSWGSIAKGLLAIAGTLMAIAVTLRIMPKKTVRASALAILALSAALVVMTHALSSAASMSWGEIAKGLVAIGGALLILAVTLRMMNTALPGVAALSVATLCLWGLVGVMEKFSKMSWTDISKGLGTIAATFALLAVAGSALSTVAPYLLIASVAMSLLGVAILAVSAAFLVFGIALATAGAGITTFVASLGAVMTGIIGIVSAIIVGIHEGLARGIISFCEIIIKGIPAIAEALKTIIFALNDVLVSCIPDIIDTIHIVLIAILDSALQYLPTIVEKLVVLINELIISILDGLISGVPDIIAKVTELLMAIFEGSMDALKNVDPEILIKGSVAIILLTGMIAALSAIPAMLPGAIAGVIGLGVVIAELALVLSILGTLSKIPGLQWLIEQGGDFLATVGTAIGKFIGGIAGGFASGASDSLPNIALNLSSFMKNLAPFIDGLKSLGSDDSALKGVGVLAGLVLSLTASNVISGLSSILSLGAVSNSPLAKFGEELGIFANSLKRFSDVAKNIDAAAIDTAAKASQSLVDISNSMSSQGGILSWVTGDENLGKFGKRLVPFGEGIAAFSASVSGINAVAMTTAANASKTLVEILNSMPTQGGILSWLTGDENLAKFGTQLTDLGLGLASFSATTIGVNPITVTAASNAAKALAEMTQAIPDTGGMLSWITGNNSVAKFADSLVDLGRGLKGFSDATIGVNPVSVTAAAGAAKALADMASVIPNQGGIASWFAGDNSVAKWAPQLPGLGAGIKGFAMAVVGINPEATKAAAEAAKSIAEMASVVPNQGGVASWFAGDNSISKWAPQLTSLGIGIRNFAMAVVGINPEATKAAADAAKSLAEMSSYIPDEGGISAWFTGESSIATFADRLPVLGKGLLGFSTSVTGINVEQVTAASQAAKTLAEMTAVIPKEGGIKAWFVGETSIANFADKLPALGQGMLGFSDSVAGINPDNVTAAANAAKALAELLSSMPPKPKELSSFGEHAVKFGEKLKRYYEIVGSIGEEGINASTGAVAAVKDLASVNAGAIKELSSAINDFVKAVKNMAKDVKADFSNTGKEAIEAFLAGLDGKLNKATKACKQLITDCANAADEKAKTKFESVGKEICKGVAAGIRNNTYITKEAAKDMAKAALQAAKDALKINSPSKEFMDVGGSVPEGFAMGIDKFGKAVVASSENMGDEAMAGVKDSIARMSKLVNSDIDAQPTIRPVLDLSDVRSGANAIGSMFGTNSVGVLANVGAISTMMNSRNQNGANNDVVSAIEGLGKELNKNGGTTYNLGGITYDAGSEVSNALQELIAALRREGRM